MNLLTSILCCCVLAAPPQRPIRVGLLQLLLADDYDGAHIVVDGVLSVEYERTLLYLSRDDADMGNYSHAIALDLDDLDPDERGELAELHWQYVTVFGVFYQEKQKAVAYKRRVKVSRFEATMTQCERDLGDLASELRSNGRGPNSRRLLRKLEQQGCRPKKAKLKRLLRQSSND